MDANQLKALHDSGNVYVTMKKCGNCLRCGVYQDLRMGACFHCSSRVDGKPLGDGLHELWDMDNPSNWWIALVPTTPEEP